MSYSKDAMVYVHSNNISGRGYGTDWASTPALWSRPAPCILSTKVYFPTEIACIPLGPSELETGGTEAALLEVEVESEAAAASEDLEIQ